MRSAKIIPFKKPLKGRQATQGASRVMELCRSGLRAVMGWSAFIPLALVYLILSVLVWIGRILCRIVMGIAALCILGSLGLGLVALLGHMKLNGPTWVNLWAVHAEFWGLLIIALLLELILTFGKDWYLQQAIQVRKILSGNRPCDILLARKAV